MTMFNNEINILQNAESVYIYGAGDVAREVAWCLMNKPYEKKIDAFIVSGDAKDEKLFDAPIVSCNSEMIDYTKLVIIAVLEKYVNEIMDILKAKGAENIMVLSFESDLWCEVRKNVYFEYVNNNYGFKAKLLDNENLFLKEEKKELNTNVYVVKSYFDKKLNEKWTDKSWETDIQVGAALTDNIICDIRDNLGENISEKNKKYCELTALYWIWKNTSESFVGLCHYRRHFVIDEEIMGILPYSDVDAVVTIPMVNIPSVEAMYEKNHDIKDWDIVREALNEISPEYVTDFDNVSKGVFYVAYNMFIMRREWLDRYCEWLFPILEYCEQRIGEKEDVYQNRYAGFLAERLFTIFLLHHKDDMNIVFADKHFLQ